MHEHDNLTLPANLPTLPPSLPPSLRTLCPFKQPTLVPLLIGSHPLNLMLATSWLLPLLLHNSHKLQLKPSFSVIDQS